MASKSTESPEPDATATPEAASASQAVPMADVVATSEEGTMAGRETRSPVCRNCGKVLAGPFCSACGQQDMPLELPFRHMVKEWFGNVFAFDSRLAHTLWPLIHRPGWLTTEYLAGRRVRYVPPLRLYFFVSVMMLFAMAWENTALISSGGSSGSGNSGSGLTLTNEDGENLLAPEDTKAPEDGSSLTPEGSDSAADDGDETETVAQTLETTSDGGSVESLADENQADSANDSEEGAQEGSREAPEEQAEDAESAFEDFVDRKITQPYRADPDGFNRKFRNRLGQTLFFLVPMFALLTKLFFRKVRPFYFHHLIFSLHLHSFAFLLLALDIALPAVGLPDVGGLIGLFVMIYSFMALRRFSEQSRWRVFGKFLLLLMLYNFFLLLTLVGTLALAVVLPG